VSALCGRARTAAGSTPSAHQHTLTSPAPPRLRGFQWLDARFGKQATFRNAITKSLAGQVTLFPAYTSLFLLYASLLEGRSLRGSWERLRERLPNLLVTGSVYW
jgi:hypothetical protein